MITWMTATNSAPSSRYSTASEPITTISDSALLMGCRCASRFIAPATQMMAKIVNISRCSIGSYAAQPSSLCVLRLQGNHQACHHQIRNGQRQQDLPAKGHQLVIAETR